MLQGNATVLEGELGGGVDSSSIADRRAARADAAHGR